MSHEVWLTTPAGVKIALLDTHMGFRYTRAVNLAGAFKLPLGGVFDDSLLAIDQRVQVWRQPTGGALYLDFQGFIRDIRRSDDKNDRRTTTILGGDMNYLLSSRIVAYAAGSAEASKSNQADDMMKDIVRENLGGSAVATRDLTGQGFSVQADTTDAPSITKAFSYRNVLTVLQELADASYQEGTHLYFGIASTSDTDIEFRTKIDQWGADRSWPDGANPVIVSQEMSNLQGPLLEFDHFDEINFVYSGGQGEEEGRNVREVEDTTRQGISIWNRREGFRDARDRETDAGVDDAGEALLNKRRPALRFNGILMDTKGTQYGLNWQFGDRVTIQYAGFTYDALVNKVEVIVDGNGLENIRGRLEILE